MSRGANDVQTRFHREWRGLAQPIEGLVFSVPVLADAQIMPEAGPDLSARFRASLVGIGDGEDDPGPSIPDLRMFFAGFLRYDQPGMIVERDALSKDMHFYAEEGRQDIRPSFAIQRGPFEAEMDDPFADFGPEEGESDDERDTDCERSPHLALVWDLRDDAGDTGLGLSLDGAEDVTGPWRYPPTAKLERLLRQVGVPVGLLCNGCELRLVYAPPGESTAHLTFRLKDMAEPAGRPVLAAFELLLGAGRAYRAAEAHTLEGLLRESRRRQADVTSDLAAQVFEAVEILLEGFEHAAQRETDDARIDWLRAAIEELGGHLYQGVLSVVLRLVFLLYAEDQGLLPTDQKFYAKHLSITGLYDELVDDAGMHPESMYHRFGAYGRLLVLFRAVFLGVTHGDLVMPPRRGRLFDPSSFPFLEGGLPGSTAAIVMPDARSEVRPPAIDDGVIHAVLARLILFEGQRLSYRDLGVEQIGSVYESLMGYHVLRTLSPAVRLGKNRVWVETAELRAMSPTDRKKFLKQQCGLTPTQQKKVDAALTESDDDDSLAAALVELSPGRAKQRDRHRVAQGRLVLQPGEERRRSGSHYTPRLLTERIVRRTLEPILACLGETPSEEQVLSLKVCDPAMGSGAFLVEACRHLADQLVAIWTRDGAFAALAERYGDPHLHARRLVAQKCLYGVDKNPAAVELAKLSLWLVTLDPGLPFTFVDHALRHGDSLVGLDLEQIAAFHWKPKKQLELFEMTLRDALGQAIEHRSEILALADHEDSVSQDEKRRLLDHAEHATARIRLVADVCVGAFFAEAKTKARETERLRRQEIAERFLGGDDDAEAELRGLAEVIRERHAPFHWWLEFPEVFYEERPDPLADGEANGAAYMEAFVGNPPFMGVASMTEQIGHGFVPWLLTVYPATCGKFDLCGVFFRRVAELSGRHGAIGLVATNTIAQGDTRLSGLRVLVSQGWTIFDAVASMPWPGTAAVTVSVVHCANGTATAHAVPTLNGKRAPVINSRLRPNPERTDPVALSTNQGHAYVGTYALGSGFVLDHEERLRLIGVQRNADRIFPFLGGQEVNSSPTQDFHRYIINFSDMPLEQAEQWPDLLAIVRERMHQSVNGYGIQHPRVLIRSIGGDSVGIASTVTGS